MGIGLPPDLPPGQVRHETIIVPEADAEAPAVLGIFQPSFPLTNAEFVTIQSPSRFWTGLGRVLLTFSVVYALPKVIGLIRSGTKIDAADWWIIGVIFALGLVCFGVSWIFSSERRAVLNSIKQFFKDNPGQPVHRPGRR
jgi:hypothetical protein